MPNPISLAAIKAVFRVIKFFDKRNTTFNKQNISNILVINTTAIGDTLLSTPAIRALKKSFPYAYVAALVSKPAKEILLENKYINELINYQPRINLPYLIKLPTLLKRLKSKRFDLVIALHGNDPDTAPIAYLTDAPHRLGWEESRLSFLFTIPIKTRDEVKHFAQVRLVMLSDIGVMPDGIGLDMPLNQIDEDEALNFLKKNNIQNGSFAGLHPFGSKSYKWWPLDRMARVGDYLYKRYNLQPIIFGGIKEREKAIEMSNMVEVKPLIAAGELSIRGSAALIKKCRLFITTDSGPMHIAQAMRTPTIALLWSTSTQTGPVNQNSVVLYGKCSNKDKSPTLCTDKILVEDVKNAVAKLFLK
jgi:heptosyltransferase-2